MSEPVLFKINPYNDIPTNDAKLLGHEEIIENLKNFIESNNMTTPISIAIHGEWGSGKTSIMGTLQNKLSSSKFKVIFFEAWRYEYSNPSLGLLNEILRNSIPTDKLLIILTNAATVLLRQFTGVNLELDNIYGMMQRTNDAPNILSQHLEDFIKNDIHGKKLVIILDDLDRCDVENALQLLAILKLFLDIKNVICIAAVDFRRLQQAWHHKYGSLSTNESKTESQKDDGRDYLEKIFQLRIAIPSPTVAQMKEFVNQLLITPHSEIVGMISYAGPRNPRAIKRLLNLISFRGSIIENDFSRQNTTTDFAYDSACIWTLLEESVGNDNLSTFYKNCKNINQIPSVGSLTSLILQYGNSMEAIVIAINNVMPEEKRIIMRKNEVMRIFENGKKLCENQNITGEVLEKHFEILYKTTSETKKYD